MNSGFFFFPFCAFRSDGTQGSYSSYGSKFCVSQLLFTSGIYGDLRYLPFKAITSAYSTEFPQRMDEPWFPPLHWCPIFLEGLPPICCIQSQIPNEVCCLRTYLCFGGDLQIFSPILYFEPRLSRCFWGKGRVAYQHFEKNHSHRPPIDCLGVPN